MEDNNMAQVRVVLSTNEPDFQLPEDTGAILISTSLKRYALSTLVNSLLERTENQIPFEFLINGRFLRTSIDEYLTTNGVSSEEILSLEYIRAIIPPEHVASFEHDDWVSSVDVLSSTSKAASWGKGEINVEVGEAKILSGSYDGLVRMWSASTSELLAISAPMSVQAQAVKSVKFLSPSKIVSAGNDRVIRIWKYDESGKQSEPNSLAGSISLTTELYGHMSSVDSVSVHAPSSRLLSASSDHTVGLWSTRTSEAPPASETLLPGAASQSLNKRRKLNSKANVSQRGPLNIFKAHSGPVTAALFSQKDHTVAYSTSWDHTLNTWDLVTGQTVSTRRTMHPLLCATELVDLGLLVVGTSARHLLAIDPRIDAKNVAGMTLRGHTGAVVSTDSEPSGVNGGGKSWGLVSASLDGTCRVWDLRSVRSDGLDSNLSLAGAVNQVCESTFVLKRESLGSNEKRVVAGDGIKVLGVSWDKEVGIVSGGEDKRVQVNQTSVPSST